MRLLSLKFRHVGPFGDQGVALEGFTPGLNVVCETNEFGKSTILRSLETVLFKPFSSADKFVKALRHGGSDDAPEGEITFESEGRTYVLQKRFLKKKGARLQDGLTGEILASDREAEEKLSRLLRAEQFASGPAGLLWVRQGLSMDGVKDDGQVASRLEGELGTLIGGEKARDFLTRVESELAAYLTPTGVVKKNGPLGLAAKSVESTQAELAVAKRLRDATQSIGLELTRVEIEISRLNAEAAQDDSAVRISQTRQAITAAQSFANQLALLEAKYAQALEAAERAGQRQSAHIEAIVTFQDSQAKLSEAISRQTKAGSDLKTIQVSAKALRDEIEVLDRRQSELGRLRLRQQMQLRQSMRSETLSGEIARLSSLIEELDNLDHQQADLTQKVSELPNVRRADIETLRCSGEELRHLEAELSALSTRLYLELAPSGQGKVSIDGDVLKSGAFELTGQSVLTISGIGVLRSDDGRLRELSTGRDQAAHAYQAMLDQFGVEDLTAAVRVADQRQQLESDRKHLTADIARLAPQGRSAIEVDFENYRQEAESLSESVMELDLELNETEESVLGDDLRDRRAKLAVVEDQLINIRGQLAKAENDKARLEERISGLSLPMDEKDRNSRTEILAREKLKAESDAQAANMEITALKQQAPTESLDLLNARLARLEQITEQSRESLESLKTQAAALRARRDAAFDGEDAAAKTSLLTARLEQEQSDMARLEREKNVRLLLKETLTRTQSQLRDAYTAPVAKELAPLLSMVIPGAEAGLGETLGVNTVQRNGRTEVITQLSGGTQEQFAILTRLAYARLLARGGASAPVILDDALVYADDARRDAMFDVLSHVSSGADPIQILYLSCHQGATSQLGGNRVRPLPWD